VLFDPDAVRMNLMIRHRDVQEFERELALCVSRMM
jgi:hypothetical protein